MTRNLLVVLLNDASLSELRAAVEERGAGTPNVYAVAPAHVGPLHWLATDEQAARDEAGVRALEGRTGAGLRLSPAHCCAEAARAAFRSARLRASNVRNLAHHR